MNFQYDSKKRDFDELSLRFEEALLRISEYEQKFSNLTIELDRANLQFNSKRREVDELRIQVTERDIIIEGLNAQLSQLNIELNGLRLSGSKEM